MKKSLSLLKLGLLLTTNLLFASCKKEEAKAPALPRPGAGAAEAHVIGFDPCTATSTSKGLVLLLSDSPDAVVAYNLPAGIYTFPQELFAGYQNNFLFPPAAQNQYKLKLEYKRTPPNQLTRVLCQANINLADFNQTTQERQIVITAVESMK